MDKGKQEKSNFAVYLLYSASILGALEQFSSAKITGIATGLFSLDMFIYIILFALAICIYKSLPLAKTTYALVALIWYAALVFYLPWKYNHALDIPAISSQVIITLLAYALFYTPQTNAKHKNEQVTSKNNI